MMNQISVIIPVYNTAPDLINRCVNSVLAQDYENFEIIIVDDGSENKDTIDTLTVLENTHQSICVLKPGHFGVSYARNYGTKSAHGEYVTYIDSDDLVHPQLLSRLMQVLEETGAIASICQETYDINELHVSDSNYHVYKGGEAIIEGMFLLNDVPPFLTLHAALYNKDLLLSRTCYHNDVLIGEDRLLNAEYFGTDNSCIVAIFDDFLYLYDKTNEYSTTNQISDKSITIALSMDLIFDITIRMNYHLAEKHVAVKTIESIISSFSVASKFNYCYSDVIKYASLAKKYKKYFITLSNVNKIKFLGILYVPQLYYFALLKKAS